MSFGRGAGFAMAYWRRWLTLLDAVRQRGMEVVILAHAALKTEESPAVGTEVKRFGMKMPDSPKASPNALMREWCDSLLFATFEEVRREDDKGNVKANPTGRRVLKTQRAMMWEAKTRWKLPPELPMSYEAYAKHRGVLSRLPELNQKAANLLTALIANPHYADMAKEAHDYREDETKLSALIQEFEAVLAQRNNPEDNPF